MSRTRNRQPVTSRFLIIGIILVAALAMLLGVAINRIANSVGEKLQPTRPNWKEYTSTKGGFTVSMPAAPEVNDEIMGTMLISTSEVYFVRHGKREEFAQLAVHIYQHEHLNEATRPKDLDELAALRQQVPPGKFPGAPQKLTKFLAEGKYPGLEMETNHEPGGDRDRWIITPTRVYFLRYTSPNFRPSAPLEGPDKFFQSFKIMVAQP